MSEHTPNFREPITGSEDGGEAGGTEPLIVTPTPASTPWDLTEETIANAMRTRLGLEADDDGDGGEVADPSADEGAGEDDGGADLGGGQATEAPPAVPTDDAAPPAAAQEAGGGSGDAAHSSEPPGDTTSQQEPPPSPDAGVDWQNLSRTYFGTELNDTQAAAMFRVVGELAGLDDTRRAQVDAILRGEALPTTPSSPTGPPSAQPQQQPQQQPQSQSPIPPRPEDPYEAELYDKYIAPLATSMQARIDALDSQLGDISQSTTQITRDQMQREQAAEAERIRNAGVQWREQHPDVTDDEYAELSNRFASRLNYGGLLNQHGTVEAAIQAGLSDLYWTDPNIRQRAIEQQIASERQQVTQDVQRQHRAAAVAGGGSPAPRDPQPPKTPTDPQERQRAMVEHARELMSNQPG